MFHEMNDKSSLKCVVGIFNCIKYTTFNNRSLPFPVHTEDSLFCFTYINYLSIKNTQLLILDRIFVQENYCIERGSIPNIRYWPKNSLSLNTSFSNASFESSSSLQLSHLLGFTVQIHFRSLHKILASLMLRLRQKLKVISNVIKACLWVTVEGLCTHST